MTSLLDIDRPMRQENSGNDLSQYLFNRARRVSNQFRGASTLILNMLNIELLKCNVAPQCLNKIDQVCALLHIPCDMLYVLTYYAYIYLLTYLEWRSWLGLNYKGAVPDSCSYVEVPPSEGNGHVEVVCHGRSDIELRNQSFEATSDLDEKCIVCMVLVESIQCLKSVWQKKLLKISATPIMHGSPMCHQPSSCFIMDCNDVASQCQWLSANRWYTNHMTQIMLECRY